MVHSDHWVAKEITMKINVEFSNIGDMVNFADFVMNQSSYRVDKKKLEDYERMLQTAQLQLDRAYARLRGESEEKGNPLLDKNISELELTVRGYNCLIAENIKTIGDLVNMTENQVRAIPNLGKGTLGDIKTELAKRGLKLKKERA
jgi:DNA-directed RNA polymerase alpha subunit